MLDDVDIEEGKRDLITREIGKFREIMKVKINSFLLYRAIDEVGELNTVTLIGWKSPFMAVLSPHEGLICSCQHFHL
jgi:hypothetical protein